MFEDLAVFADMAARIRAEQETPLLAICHPTDMWTVLDQVRRARAATIADQVRRQTAWLYPPPRHITVCPRWHVPLGTTIMLDPLGATR